MMRASHALALLILVATVPSAGDVRARPMSLLIVTLDTTRWDRLSTHGLMDQPMPALERMAREGTVFEQAISVSPLTLPSHTTIFTGLLPPHHGVRDNIDNPLSPAHTTLAERLRAQGFRTAAVTASIVLDSRRGLAQGFERYSGVAESAARSQRVQRRADDVVDDAITWLSTVD